MRLVRLIGGAALSLAMLSGTAWAEAVMLPTLSGEYIKDSESFRLAASESDVLVKKESAGEIPAPQAAEFEPPMFTGSKIHQYLGIATVAAAAATFVTHFHPCEGPNCGTQQPRQTNGAHAKWGKATAVLAAATVASGLISHWDDFHKEDGISDPDNLHVLLGVTGAALMAYAINKSANSSTTPTSHAAMAELGALSMVVAIKLTW